MDDTAKLLQRAEQAEEAAKQAQQEAQQLREQNRKTSLLEYLMANHDHVAMTFDVETDKSFTSCGFTNPMNRKYPTSLQPWGNFLKHQGTVMSRLKELYPFETAPQVFPSVPSINTTGEDLALRTPIANEKHLLHFEYNAVRGPLTRIVGHLKNYTEIRDRFHLGDGITLDDNQRILHSSDDEHTVQHQGSQHVPPNRSSGNASNGNYTSTSVGSSALTSTKFSPMARTETPPRRMPQMDQVAVYAAERGRTGNSTLAFFIEYKAPHKLTPFHWERGLAGLEFKDFNEEVISKVKLPSDPDARIEHDAKELVAKTIAQTYDYMIRTGVKYSYVSTGEVLVFLHIRKDNPKTLYYWRTQPADDVAQHRHNPNFQALLPFYTTVGQVLIFSLLALGTRPRTQRWRSNWLRQLPNWVMDDELMLASLPESPKKQVLGKRRRESNYTSQMRPDPNQPPYETRSRAKRQQFETCNSTASVHKRDNELPDPPGPNDEQRALTRMRSHKEKAACSALRRSHSQPRSSSQSRSYCTQKCLIGLMSDDVLDRGCPNYFRHGGKRNQIKRHAINHMDLLNALRDQLGQDLDHFCIDLDIHGARGAIFQVRSRQYGYTVIAKGTVRSLVKYVRQEYQIYQQLRALQGQFIPVCLGNIDLIQPYQYGFGLEIVHMMFLAWGGEPLPGYRLSKPTLTEEVSRSLKAIRDKGVIHRDVHPPNMLWNEEAKQVMLIDFERSTRIQPKRLLPSQITKKRKFQEGRAFIDNKESKVANVKES